jgi:hypothetical protein
MRFISSVFLIVLMWNVLSDKQLHAQPTGAIYATNATGVVEGTFLTGYGEVTDPAKAYASKPNNDFATLKSIGATQSAALHLTFSQPISSPTTFYIRTDREAVNNTHGVSVNAYAPGNGNNAISIPNYQTHFLADGTVFLSVAMTASFQAVRITISTGLLETIEVKVYSAFYSPQSTNSTNPYPFNSADCGLPNVTTITSSGLTLLGSNNILNPERAIDQDPTSSTYSTFSISGVNTGSLKQIFHFNGNANAGDGVKIVMAKGSSLLNVELLKKITVQVYSGNTLVGNAALVDDLLALDLLGLFSQNSKVDVYFRPSNNNPSIPVIFDRVEIAVNINGLGISTGTPLQIYDVRRTPEMPIEQDIITHCDNLILNIPALSNQESILPDGLTFRWYEQSLGGVSTAIGKVLSPLGLTAPVIKDYYVETIKTGCTTTSPSARRKVTVKLLKAPLTPPIDLSQ